MSNLITDGGAELDSVLWSLSTGASRTMSDSYAGAWSFKLAKTSGFPATGGLILQSMTMVIGRSYRVQQWVSGSAAGSKPLRVIIGTGADVVALNDTDYSAGWHLFDFGTITPTLEAGKYQAFLLDIGAPGGHFWLVDEIVVEDVMAIKLAERGVDAVAAMLLSKLSAELSAIETDRGDSITLEVPTAAQYFKRPKAEIQGGTTAAHVEVYESTFTLEQPYSDAAVQRATFELPLTVRLTYFNRLGHTPAVMNNQMRRYAAGLYNCFIRNYQLDDADDSTQWGYVTSVIPFVDVNPDTDAVRKVSVTLNVIVKCEETYS